MNNDKVHGTVDEAVGSAKQVAGKLTGNTGLRIEGVAQKIKGKLENAVGNIKDGILETNLKSQGQDSPHS